MNVINKTGFYAAPCNVAEWQDGSWYGRSKSFLVIEFKSKSLQFFCQLFFMNSTTWYFRRHLAFAKIAFAKIMVAEFSFSPSFLFAKFFFRRVIFAELRFAELKIAEHGKKGISNPNF